jgi:hypothetical protein
MGSATSSGLVEYSFVLTRGNIIALTVAAGLAACGGKTERDFDAGETGEPTSSGGADGGSGGVASSSDESPVCGPEGQSCSGMTGTECSGESCCRTILLPGGSFPMGRGTEACGDCAEG